MNKRKLIFITLLLLVISGCGRYITSSRFEDVPVPPAPDYSDVHNWAALPFINNPSEDIPIDTMKRKGDSLWVDVFFIHPTTYTYPPKNQYKWNADVTDEYLNNKTDNSTILYQASVFNGVGKIYAPRYRQAHLSAFFTKNKEDREKALNLAYQDVKAAFQYYLAHYNHGRPIIIASHSQGTIHALHLLKDFFDGKPLQKKLVAAYLIGMAIPKDSLCCISPCTNASDTDCWVSWNTIANGYYPPYYKEGLNHSICTNPLTWKTDTTYAPYSLNEGGILRDFHTIVPHISDAQVHEGMLWIDKPMFRGSNLFNFKIYHIVDYNLFYMNIRENVRRRVHVFTGR